MIVRSIHCRDLVTSSMCVVFQCLIVSLFVALWSPCPARAQELSVSGITEPVHDVTLSSSVEGKVAEIYFKEGARVKKNETILELDKRLEELEVERRKVLWESKAELNSAVAQVATLESVLNATRELFETTGSVSKEELEKQELEYALAVAEQQRFEIAEKREKIEYEMALEQLRKRVLRSPIRGHIVKLFLEQGETCESREPLVQVVDTGQCRFVCTVEERVGRTLKKRQSVDLQIQAGPGAVKRKGKISFISPVVDPASGLQEVKVLFDNRDAKVWPGVAGVMLLDVQ